MPFLSRALFLAVLVTTSLLALSAPATAAETASSELVIIREGDVSEGDLYATAVRVIIEGTVDGDLIAFAAEEVIISGTVTGSVLAVAPTVTVSGDVGAALRASANRVEVSGSVGTDLVAAAVRVDLGPESQIGGDALVWTFTLTASGTIGANLEGSQRVTQVQGTVEGDVDISVGQLAITGPFVVNGDLGYRSEVEARGLEQAEVGGVVVHKTPLPPNIRVRALGMLARFLVVLGLTAAAVLVAWGWPERTRSAGDSVRESKLKAFGYGALFMFSPIVIALVAALVALLTPGVAGLPLLVIFGPLIIATGGIVLVTALFAGVPAVLVLGEVLPRKFGLFGSVLVGSVMAGVLWLVPLVGWLIPLIVLPTGLGGWILSFRRDTPDPEPSLTD